MARIVVALGGNALLKRGEELTASNQRRNARIAAEALAPLCAEHEVVITHGNGPQVGLLALQELCEYVLDLNRYWRSGSNQAYRSFDRKFPT